MKIFWSWQSDTPGKIGRHFVRDALIAAITTLKESEEVEEPTERDRKDALHLDHDRQGVSGSPDLCQTIFSKIDETAVFIADVTPVSTIPSSVVDGEEVPEKRNMNPNVAIELGYALKSVTDRNVLMVLNTCYGGRKFLPFDLAHKAGPITFCLTAQADKKALKAEAAALKGKLVIALRPYLAQGQPDGPERKSKFNESESLAVLLATGDDIIQRQRKMATDRDWANDPKIGVREREGQLWRESVRRHFREKYPPGSKVLDEMEDTLRVEKHIFDEKYNRAQGTTAGMINSYLNHSYLIQALLKRYG